MKSFSLILDKKMGFSPMGGSSIFSKDMYYNSECENALFYVVKPGFDFNLPEGEYIVIGDDFYCLPEPVNFSTIAMPNHECYFEVEPFVNFGDVESTAFIDRHTGEIRIDKGTWNSCGMAEREYILQHEIAHLFFNTETFCDMYAENEMLYMGYNPSQIVMAADHLLRLKAENIKRFSNSMNRMSKQI